MLTWNLIILLFSSNQGGFAIPCCEKSKRNQRKTSRTVHTNNMDRNNSLKSEWVPGFGRVSASLLRLVRLSAPSWFRIPGSISVSCLFSACPVIVKVLAAREAWTFGLLKWITVPWFVNIFTYKRKKGSDTLKTNESHILFFCYIMLIMIFNISYNFFTKYASNLLFQQYNTSSDFAHCRQQRVYLPPQCLKCCWLPISSGRTEASCHLL